MHVGIVGAGFTGLTAALELAKSGHRVSVIERDTTLGGLAGGFDVHGMNLEKFYHHWFVSDKYVMDLIHEIGAEDSIVLRPTRTGLYFANQMYRLSKPFDLLKFTPLSLMDRLRLGLMVLRARQVSDWMSLEGLSAQEWLIKMCGERVFRIVWEPLLVGKFGRFASDVSAVWFWKKIALRGGSRSDTGEEVLAYFRGGFSRLADLIADRLHAYGVAVITNCEVQSLYVENGKTVGIETSSGKIKVDALLLTPALPIIADLLGPHVCEEYVEKLRRIRYLANVCLVLELSHSLSDTYWLNVNDPTFPFVGVIEHTNFEPPASYGGSHIVYLSKYLPASDPVYRMSSTELFDFAFPHIKRMFPLFERSWVRESHAWKADYAQPIMERHYSSLMPARQTPLSNTFISTMAQVYPEDRGTNYAVREGLQAARLISALETPYAPSA